LENKDHLGRLDQQELMFVLEHQTVMSREFYRLTVLVDK
jgi:hypothetical protein